MKTVSVSVAGRAAVQVQLNRWSESDTLTAAMARAAMEAAAGLGSFGTVSDGGDAWRVTPSGARRIQSED